MDWKMNNSLFYRLSLGFAILLSLLALVSLLSWFGTLINGFGRVPVLALIPWNTLGLVALAAINCTIRARFIVRKSRIF
jgi:hypothetical protein